MHDHSYYVGSSYLIFLGAYLLIWWRAVKARQGVITTWQKHVGYS